MIAFCKLLYEDISAHFDEWVDFRCYFDDEDDVEEYKKHLQFMVVHRIELEQKLARLKYLIEEREESFGTGYCFH